MILRYLPEHPQFFLKCYAYHLQNKVLIQVEISNSLAQMYVF